MIQPISFNVLRQCLDKMGLPQATMRVLSSYRLPDGTQTAEYLLTFSSFDIVEWMRVHHFEDNLGGYLHFRDTVAQSFSTDITVLEEYDNSHPGWHGLIAHVRVPPHAEQLTLLTEDDEA